MIPQQDHPSATCDEVLQWPEFQALAKRLGIDLTRPYKSLGIELNFSAGGYFPFIKATYLGCDSFSQE